MPWAWAWWVHFFGLDYTAPYGRIVPYDAWSGVLSDVSELALVGAVIGVLRRYNCHVHHCWRVGRHKVDGTPYVVCRHHHPHGPVTAEQVLAEHAAAMTARAKGGSCAA